MKNTQSDMLELILPGLRIAPLLQKDLDDAQAHLDDLTKPQGSLGRLEDLAQRLYAMSGGQTPIIMPTMRTIDSLVIMLRPTGEMHSSAIEWMR